MLTGIETPIFQEYARSVWKDAEREAFIDWIAVNADMGDVIPGGGQFAQGALGTRRHGQAGWRTGDLFQPIGQWRGGFAIGLRQGQAG